jgi:hypothetical protein
MKKNSKLLIVLGSSVVLVAVVLAALWLTLWAQPGVQDYQAAHKTAHTAETSYPAIKKTFTAYIGSLPALYKKGFTPEDVDAFSKKDREAFNGAVRTHTENVKAIENEKALRDDEFKRLYDTYAEKELANVEYLASYASANTLYSSATNYTCADIYTASRGIETDDQKKFYEQYAANTISYAEDCLKDLKELKSSTNKPFSVYGTAYEKMINSRKTAVEQLADGKLSQTQFAAASQKGIEKFEKATSVFIVAHKNALKTIDDTSAADAFYAYTHKKSEGTK